MSTDYPYTSVVNAPDGPSIHVAVAASAMTDKAIEGVSWEGDTQTLTVTMEDTLSGGDEALLDAIVAACPDATNLKPIRCVEFDCGGTGKDGNFMLLVIGADEDEDTGFVVPDDFGTLISLKIAGYAMDGTAFGAGKNIDLVFEYAGDGELHNANSYSETVATYTTGSQLDEWFEIDFTALAPDLTAGDKCCLNIKHTSVGGYIGYKAIIMEYRIA